MVRALLVLLLFPGIAIAQDTPTGPTIEQSGVAEILSRRCLSCHNDAVRRGELSLQSREGIVTAGLVTPGDASASHMLEVLQSQGGKAPQMPKDSDPLTTAEIQKIRTWIEQGAQWPKEFLIQEAVVSDFDWWSFQPVQRPELPVLNKETVPDHWKINPIDAFILQHQFERGLSPALPAEKQVLIRRVTYDLTGLPPTPEEIDAFVNDPAEDAYLKLVNRLLDSPAYGEQQARYWLDVVKYADTCGYDKDKLRENAWPYRDYVIRSFNQDKPYSRFVQEQLAGDVLFPNEPDGILGLGFIAAGPWDFIGHVEVSEAKLDGKVARNLDRDDMVSNTLNTFCSLTIQCARCHNHKFDPFTQEHYYGLQSIFAAVDRAERPYDLDVKIEQQRRELVALLKQTQTAEQQLQQEIEAAGGEELKRLHAEIATLSTASQPVNKKNEFGYHSQIAKQSESVKWVQVDLGEPVEVSQVVLHPCHDDYAGIGAGFGFPVRYRVEGALSLVDFDAGKQPVLLANETTQDVLNPGLRPVEHLFPSTRIRYVRITATHLAERKDDFILAMAELEVSDTQGENLALHREVSALDSIEAPVRWGKRNLTDGIWAQSGNPEAEVKLAEKMQQRTAIQERIETPKRRERQLELKTTRENLQSQLKQLPAGKMVYAAATHFTQQGNFKPTQGTPRTVQLLYRGNIDEPQREVLPGLLPLHQDDSWRMNLSPVHQEGERRAALAQWISRPDHPLTWRSIVNRIWLTHFGEGLVPTLNDFGRMGELPSHPELLDWLAVEFREGGESFKQLHRLIVTSATYRQSSQHNARNAAIDASNRYLWRMNRQRLSAEQIRDTILSVSGQLDRTAGGPGDRLFVLEHPEHSPHYEYHLFDPAAATRHRRSIYRFVVRSQPDPWMTVLDCADSSQSTPKRLETLTALQALSLMNNAFTLVMAERFAERLQAENETLTEQLKRGFRLTTGRSATTHELDMLTSYSAEHGLQNTCRLLLNTSEMMFVD